MTTEARGLLVTGATTPVGELLVREALADPRVSTVLAVGLEPRDRALPLTAGDRLVYKELDLRRSRRVHDLLFGLARDLRVSTVVHLSMHRSAAARGSRVHALNVDALRNLLALCERHPTIRRFVVRSFAEVYQVSHRLPILVTEDHPLNLSPSAPQYIRDRVEADLTACTRMGMSPLEIVVLRCAEVLSAGTSSQLWDYLDAPFCLRPAGFDPMLNVLSRPDIVLALQLASHTWGVQGVFNVPGADTLPLTACIRAWGRVGIPAPGGVIAAAYRMRTRLRAHQFSYGMNARRFHYASVLDGTRARDVLGYAPRTPIDWPVPPAGVAPTPPLESP